MDKHLGCCQTLKLESWGGADYYQPQLLGSYGQISELNGKPVYRQIDGSHYLYWLSIGVWTVNEKLYYLHLNFKMSI